MSLFFGIVLSTVSFACINSKITLLSGEVVRFNAHPISGIVKAREFDLDKLRLESDFLLKRYELTDSIHYLSDYASTLIYLGDYKKAKRIYLDIESRYPDRYMTASNLGTAYELLGKPDSALIWIRKAVKLNPKSHKGSEWIHIKILEFKLGKSERSGSLLGLDFGNDVVPVNKKGYNLYELGTHIEHQLMERQFFVKPKDEIVGRVYFDYGNVLAQNYGVKSALESYLMAKAYGFESELLNERLQKSYAIYINSTPQRLFAKEIDRISRHPFLLLILGFVGLVIGTVLIVRLIKLLLS